MTSAATNFKTKQKQIKSWPHLPASWNVLIELASDLLPESSDRAAEVLHRLSCRSFNESVSLIPDITLTSPGTHLFQGNIHRSYAFKSSQWNEKLPFIVYGGKIKAENLVIHCVLRDTVRVEVKGAQPRELSFLLPYHAALRQRQIYVDAIDQWVAYQAGRESRDFKQLPGCPSITLISAVLELGLSHLDGQLTAAWGMVW